MFWDTVRLESACVIWRRILKCTVPFWHKCEPWIHRGFAASNQLEPAACLINIELIPLKCKTLHTLMWHFGAAFVLTNDAPSGQLTDEMRLKKGLEGSTRSRQQMDDCRSTGWANKWNKSLTERVRAAKAACFQRKRPLWRPGSAAVEAATGRI